MPGGGDRIRVFYRASTSAQRSAPIQKLHAWGQFAGGLKLLKEKRFETGARVLTGGTAGIASMTASRYSPFVGTARVYPRMSESPCTDALLPPIRQHRHVLRSPKSASPLIQLLRIEWEWNTNCS
jgi:hypothetical protein